MTNAVLFDKSFLQSISTDESVWFDHFFMPIVSPLFYVETLADLKKESDRWAPEVGVQIIAEKFPENNGVPCIHHFELCLANLLGKKIPMDGRLPVPRGRLVRAAGVSGIVFDESLEAQAFSRWSKQQFSALEHDIASKWREQLTFLNLPLIQKGLKSFGINREACRTIEDAKQFADAIVNKNDNPFERMNFVLETLQIPKEYHQRIFEHWKLMGYKSLRDYAPYAAHVLTVKIFFSIALATDFISADRPSNWADISYLYYLPFCSFFASSDKLHRLCAPLFLRKDDQEFIWGIDFKADLKVLNEHYKQLPPEVTDQGITSFARYLPEKVDLKLKSLWSECSRQGRGRASSEDKENFPRQADPNLLNRIANMKSAPALNPADAGFDSEDADGLYLERQVHRKKGSWYQIPKDFKA